MRHFFVTLSGINMNRRVRQGKYLVLIHLLGMALLFGGCASWGFTLAKRPGSGTQTSQTTSTSETTVQAQNPASVNDSGHNLASQESTKDGEPGAEDACALQGTCEGNEVFHDPCENAEASIAQARKHEIRGEWKDAFDLAIQSSACEAWEPSSRSIAFHAVTQLDTASLQVMWQGMTDTLGVAACGMEIIRRCIATDDPECVSRHLDVTLAALYNIGTPDDMNEVMAWLNTSQNEGNAVVAVALPLSGRDRKMGRAMLGAFLQASGVYDHKRLVYDLRFYDTRSDASTLEEILADAAGHGAKVLLGPIDTQEAAAAASAASKHGMLMIALAANPAFLKNHPDARNLSFSLDIEIEQIDVALINATKVVAAYPEGKYGDMVTEELRKRLNQKGATLDTITYPPTEMDLRKIAQKIVAAKPDAIFLPAEAKDAERLMSFVAQENMWCQTTENLLRGGSKSKTDTRQWVTCISTSVWAPLPASHDYKFLVGAKYLDYSNIVPEIEAATVMFEKLYHRKPNVYEIIPFVAIMGLNRVENDFRDPQKLKAEFLAHPSNDPDYWYVFPTLKEVFL